MKNPSLTAAPLFAAGLLITYGGCAEKRNDKPAEPPKALKTFPRPIALKKGGSGPSPSAVRFCMGRITSLHTPFGKPRPGDWVLSHPEPGQTFAEYLECKPVLPRGKRHVLYVQPIGDFTAAQRKIIELSAEFMGLYFNLPVTVMADVSLAVIPKRARRVHPTWGDKQILSTYVLDEVLRPRLPDDAAAFIAFAGSDLWPGEGWNFVFGQASTRHRVGVWSIYRNGDPVKEFERCLLRTIKTATHETGHMFTLMHCTAYECNMCGSNSRRESDRRPLALCPECLAKVCWACEVDPAARYEKLQAFCSKYKLTEESVFYAKSIVALR